MVVGRSPLIMGSCGSLSVVGWAPFVQGSCELIVFVGEREPFVKVSWE